MKAPQERKTGIRIDKYTVVDGMADNENGDNTKFIVLTKTSDRGSNYHNFLWTDTVAGAEALRDVLQYILSAMDDTVDAPERYENHTPLSERQRAFTETHDDWENSKHGDDCKLRVSKNTTHVAVDSLTEYGNPSPIHFNDVGEVETLIEALNVWIDFEQSTQ